MTSEAFEEAKRNGIEDGVIQVVVALSETDFRTAGGSLQQIEFTPRELDVLRSLACGLANKAIARELKLSDRTVRNYLVTAFAKLGVKSRSQAVKIIIERNLI